METILKQYIDYDITLSLVMQSSFNKFFFLDKIHLLGLVVGIRGKHLVSQ